MISKPRTDPAYREGDLIGGEYELRSVLGVGGLGIVYLVYHQPSRSVYALKTFRDDFMHDEATRQQFRKEAQMWVALERHPYLVRAFHVTELQKRLFIALEYIAPNQDGLNSLDGYLAQSPPDLRQSLVWGIQFCDGMTYAYGKGLRCHRDIKPANIMVTQNGMIKISDVGLAGVLTAESRTRGNVIGDHQDEIGRSLLTIGGAVGTPTHMPPEQFADASLCDQRSDIYSFGVVLYQMRNSGHLPLLATVPKDNSESEMIRFWTGMRSLHSQAPIPELKSRAHWIIQRCLEKDPRRRYQTFEQLCQDLKTVLRQQFGETVSSPPTHELEAWELCNKGGSLYALGHVEQSLLLYDEALKLAPRFTAAWNNKGIALKRLGLFEQALNCFNEALRHDPRYETAWNNKGSCLNELGRYKEALICLDHALDLCPNSAGTWLNKGISFLAAGRTADARTCFNQCLLLNPRDAGAWYKAGVCNQILGHPEEAIQCFDRAIELDPIEISAYCAKALCLSLLNRNEEALAVTALALHVAPSTSGVWFIKAGIEDQLGQTREALSSYRRFVELAGQSDFEKVQYAKSRLAKF